MTEEENVLESEVDNENEADFRNSEKSHQCNICGKSFINNVLLQTHHRVHSGERPERLHFLQ